MSSYIRYYSMYGPGVCVCVWGGGGGGGIECLTMYDLVALLCGLAEVK